MEPFAQEDLVVLALIPDYHDTGRREVEVSKEAWPLVSAVVRSVTIALESGASRSPMAFHLFFPTESPIGAIDQPNLLPFNRASVLGRLSGCQWWQAAPYM